MKWSKIQNFKRYWHLRSMNQVNSTVYDSQSFNTGVIQIISSKFLMVWIIKTSCPVNYWVVNINTMSLDAGLYCFMTICPQQKSWIRCEALKWMKWNAVLSKGSEVKPSTWRLGVTTSFQCNPNFRLVVFSLHKLIISCTLFEFSLTIFSNNHVELVELISLGSLVN